MSLNTLYFLLANLSVLISLVPIIFSFFYFRAFNPQLRALFVYLLISVLTEVVAYYCGLYFKSNYWVFHIFTMIEGPLIFYIYYREFNQKKASYIFLGCTLIVLTLGLIQFSFNASNNMVSSVEALLISGCALAWFYKVFVDMTIPKLTNYYFFWLNSGFLIYFLGPFFISIFEGTIRESDNAVLNFLWIIHVAINVLFNVLLTIGICKIKRK